MWHMSRLQSGLYHAFARLHSSLLVDDRLARAARSLFINPNFDIAFKKHKPSPLLYTFIMR
jgi:hypothetical protein